MGEEDKQEGEQERKFKAVDVEEVDNGYVVLFANGVSNVYSTAEEVLKEVSLYFIPQDSKVAEEKPSETLNPVSAPDTATVNPVTTLTPSV